MNINLQRKVSTTVLILSVSTITNAQLSNERIAEQLQYVDALTGWPVAIIKASLALGFVTMIIVEPIKTFYRPIYHRNKIFSWLAGHTVIKDRFSSRKEIDEIMRDLLLLSGGGAKMGFYDLPMRNISGQISLASQTVLDSPTVYSRLLIALLGKSYTREDVQLDVRILTEMSPSIRTEDPLYFEARNRLANHIQRNIDALQITSVFQWKRLIHLLCISIGFISAAYGTFVFAKNIDWGSKFLFVILLGYMGALLASFLRNLLTLLQRNKHDHG